MATPHRKGTATATATIHAGPAAAALSHAAEGARR